MSTFLKFCVPSLYHFLDTESFCVHNLYFACFENKNMYLVFSAEDDVSQILKPFLCHVSNANPVRSYKNKVFHYAWQESHKVRLNQNVVVGRVNTFSCI